jgi:hypothetical protein
LRQWGYTPFQYAGNSPIELIDIDGSEGGKEILLSLKKIGDAISDFFTFESEKEEIIEGANNMGEGVNKQIIGPWNAYKIYTSENPGLEIAYRKADGYIQATTGVVQLNSGVQGISNKVQTVVEIPLIIKDLSQAAIKKGTSNGVKGSIKPEASPQATKTYKISDDVPEWGTSTQKPVADKITGYTNHGLNQAIGRDGGKGVNAKAMVDAVKNPKQIVPGSGVGTTAYKGKSATVVLNQDGKVVTTMTKKNYRGARQQSYHNPNRKSGSGSAQRKANAKGFSYNPNAIR